MSGAKLKKKNCDIVQLDQNSSNKWMYNKFELWFNVIKGLLNILLFWWTSASANSVCVGENGTILILLIFEHLVVGILRCQECSIIKLNIVQNLLLF